MDDCAMGVAILSWPIGAHTFVSSESVGRSRVVRSEYPNNIVQVHAQMAL